MVRRGRTLRMRRGFTLVEAMVAVALTAMAGAAVLLGVQSSVQTSSHTVEQMVADGLAHQLMDEITGCRYVEHGSTPYQVVLCPGADEIGSGTRELFDDIDDFHQFSNRPPVDAWGIKLGRDDGKGDLRNQYFMAPRGLLDHLRRTVEVYYVNPNDLSEKLSAGSTSDYRAVEVSVFYREDSGDQRLLAKLRRIVVNLDL